LTQISSSQQAFSRFSADQKLTRQELVQLKAVFQQENPQAAEAQFDSWLEANLAHKIANPQDTHAVLADLKAGKSDSVLLFFEDQGPPPAAPKASPVQVHVEGLNLEDINGFENRSPDDLKGSIQKIDLKLSQDFIRQIAQQTVQGLSHGLAAAEVEYQAPENGEPGYYKIKAGGLHVADLRSENGRLFLDYAAKPDPNGVAPRLDQTPPGWADAVLGWTSQQVNAGFDAAVGALGYDPQQTRQAISQGVSDAATWAGDRATEGLAWVTGNDPEVMKQFFADGTLKVDAGSGIQSVLDLDWDREKGRVYIHPGTLSLNGKDLAGTGSLVDGSRVSLQPQNPQLSILPDGRVQISSENAQITGSSSTEKSDKGVLAEPRQDLPPDQLSVKQADLELRQEGDKTSLEIKNAEGHLEAAGVLTDQRIQTLKTQIDQVLTQIDSSLKNYGLDRQSFEKILAQVPSDLLKSLLSSANQGELAQAAQNLGLDPAQLGQFVSFLKEEPVQALLGDVQKLTQSLASDTRLQGSLDFKLERLNLEADQKSLLTQIQGLDLQTHFQARTPTGTETEGQVSAHLASAALAADAQGTRVNAGPIQADLKAAIRDSGPDFSSRLAAFKQELLSRDPKQLLTPQGITPGRTGLSHQTVRQLLEKFSDSELHSLAQADEQTLKNLANQKKLPLNYLAYLRKYFQDQGFVGQTQTKLNASAGFQAFESDGRQHRVDAPQASVRVSTEADDKVLSETGATVSAEQIRAHSDQGAIESAARLMGFRLGLKDKPAQALLTPQGLTPGRTGLSFQTVKAIMAQVTDQEWRQVAQMNPAARSQFAKAKGIQPNYLEYMLQYFNQQGFLPSAAEATGLKLKADATVNGPEGQTQSNLKAQAEAVRTSPQGLTVQGVDAQADLKTPGAQVSAELRKGSVIAREDRLALNGTLEKAKVTNANGHFEAQGQLSAVVQPNQGLAADLQSSWSLDTQGDKAHTRLTGQTDLEIQAGKIVGSETDQLRGVSTIRSEELMRLARNHPDLQQFLNLLGQQFKIENPSVAVKVQDGALSSDAQAQLDWDLKLGVNQVQTSLGKLDVSVQAGNQGVSGSVTLSPSQMAISWLNDLVAQKTGEKTQTRLNQGRIEVGFDHSVVSDILVGAKISGDTVEIKVDQAKLFGFLDLDLIHGSARDTILEQLQKQGITKASARGSSTIKIPVQDLMRQILGPEASKHTRLNPSLGADNKLRIDFDYHA